jgi:hypothetical protein
MSNVTDQNIVLLAPTSFAPGNPAIAAGLRDVADQIEAGCWGDVRVVIALLETYEGELERVTIGDVIDLARVVGLLTMAIHRAV